MTWNVPRLIGHLPPYNNYSSIWDGIGSGLNGSQLLQSGSAQDAVCTNSSCSTWTQKNYLWFESLPAMPYSTTITNLGISPGQSVESLVNYQSGTTTYTLCNWTTATCVSPQTPYGAPDAQFEWILERTLVQNSLWALPDYSYDNFTGATWSSGSIIGTEHDAQNRLTMTNVAQTQTLSSCSETSTTSFKCDWIAYH